MAWSEAAQCEEAANRPGDRVAERAPGRHNSVHGVGLHAHATAGHSAYGALAYSDGDKAGREHALRRQRRWVQAGSAGVVLAFVVLLAASVERSSPSAVLESIPAGPVALETGATAETVLGPQPGAVAPNSRARTIMLSMLSENPEDETYCAVFSDPAECKKQVVKGTMKYWTGMQVKGELWKTMKALAELELRESTMHKAHKAKSEDQAKLFDLFRQTMSQEVADIHRIQGEMHQKHTAAFKQLVLQLSDMAMDLKNDTDANVATVNGRIDSLQRTHDFDNQRVLKELAVKINLVNRKIEDLNRESMTAVNGTQAYAEDVESAMKAGDVRLDGMITQIEIDTHDLDAKEMGDWDAMSNALQEAEEKQEANRQTLDTKIDTDVGDLRTKSSDALTAEKADIRQQLSQAMEIVAEGIVSLTQNTTHRYDGIQGAIDKMIAEQTANNQEQDEHVAKLRGNFAKDRDAAFARLDSANKRIDKAFSDLAAANGMLETEAAADKEFLLSKINADVSFRYDEAAALRGWGKIETGVLNKSLVTTQNSLDLERNRLQAQRDADMVAMPAKITGDVDAWNASVNSQMDTDNTVIHATLTTRMQEAGDALDVLKGQMTTKNVNLQAQYDGMKKLQDENNGLQQKAINDLQRDSLLEKALSEAKLAVLDGNLTVVMKRLQTVKSEITGIQDTDRADIRSRVEKGFANAKTKLEADLSKGHTTLWSKLNGGVTKISNRLTTLQNLVENRETRLMKFSDDIMVNQRRQSSKQNLAMDQIDRVQKKDEREIVTNTDTLLTMLGTLKARLTTELSRVGTERDRDDAKMRGKIIADNNATETDANANLAAAHGKMSGELTALMSELTATLDAHKQLEETHFQDLVGNLKAWDASQTAQNDRQRTWLQSIADAGEGAARNIGAQTTSLATALKSADTRLMTAATVLENREYLTAHAMNKTLHADIASLNAASFAYIARNDVGLKNRIKSDIGELTSRLNLVQSTSLSTKMLVESATDAMHNKMEARRVARTAEIAGIVKTAADDKSRFQGLIDALRQRIATGKLNIATELKKSAAERVSYSSGIKSYIASYVGSSQANSSLVLAQTEASQFAEIQQEVDTWSQDLKSNRVASITEAATVEVKLKQLQATELAHSTTTKQRLVELLSSVTSSKDSADTALAALRVGLNVENVKLNQTVSAIAQDHQDDTARILAHINEGLIELRANFSIAEAAQLESMKGTLKTQGGAIDAQRSKLLADTLRKEGLLQQSLIEVRAAQEGVSTRHQAQYVVMKKKQEELKTRLQSALDLVEGTVRLSANKFENSQHRVNAIQTQDFTDLAAKLERATTELTTVSGDVRTEVEKKMQVAKSQLGQARSALDEMHRALVREQASDRVTIKDEVTNRLEALSSQLSSNIQSAVTTLHTALNVQLSTLSSGVDQIQSKTLSAEGELKAKMNQLETNEATHDTAQAAKIKTMQALLQSVETRTSVSSKDLTANITRVEALMNVGVKTLNSVEDTDTQTMLSQILGVVTHAKAVLDSTVRAQKASMRQVVHEMLSMENAVAQEKVAAKALQDELDLKIRTLSQGDSVGEGQWNNDVQTLYYLLHKLRIAAHRNNTEVHTNMKDIMDKVERDQFVLNSQAMGDRAEFKTLSNTDAEALKVNFTIDMSHEATEVLAAFQHTASNLDDKIESKFQGPKDTEVDLKKRIQSFMKKMTTGFNSRDREIRAINSTNSGYQDSMAAKIQRFEAAVSDAAYAGETAKNHNFARLDRMRTHLQQLLVEASGLVNLKAQIEAVESRVGVVNRAETEDYSAIAQGNGNINGNIGMWRSQLQESANRLKAMLEEETGKRQASHADSLGEMQASSGRMGHVERDIWLMEKRLQESRGRTPPDPAMAPAAPPLVPPGAAPATAPAVAPAAASAAAPNGAPTGAPDAAAAAAPPASEPEGPPTLPPAPAPNRLPLAAGETPSPEPIPWWEYRTQTSGVDVQNGKVALINGATTGFLKGVYPLSADGRWVIYSVMYAEEGDTGATIKVTYNGDVQTTVNNAPNKGFPCNGNKCLDTTGRYVVEGTIESGTVEYLFEFTATKSDRPSPNMGSRMWLGAGEAAFTGTSTEAPPIPDGARQTTQVQAISAMTGKATKIGSKGSDGHDKRGYVYATDARLTVLWGKAVVWEGIMKKSKAKVMVPAAPDGGYYTCVVTQAGMMAVYSKYCSVSKGESKISLALVPVMTPGEAKLVLTWGDKPKDLDIYVLAPHSDPSQPECEVNWRNKKCHSRTVTLDRDDTRGHGPETISLQNFNSGKYIVRVDEYKGNPARSQMSAGHATVAFYSPHMGGVFNYVDSTGFVDGRVWYAIAIDGETRQPTPCTPQICPVRSQPRD